MINIIINSNLCYPLPMDCPCGLLPASLAGLCRPCYRARAHSRARFSGHRESVLQRDARTCRVCGAGSSGRRLHVHHRRPGASDPELLLTVCAACHARLHKLAALRRWVPGELAELWAEQHPRAPLQLQFPFHAPAEALPR